MHRGAVRDLIFRPGNSPSHMGAHEVPLKENAAQKPCKSSSNRDQHDPRLHRLMIGRHVSTEASNERSEMGAPQAGPCRPETAECSCNTALPRSDCPAV